MNDLKGKFFGGNLHTQDGCLWLWPSFTHVPSVMLKHYLTLEEGEGEKGVRIYMVRDDGRKYPERLDIQ